MPAASADGETPVSFDREVHGRLRGLAQALLSNSLDAEDAVQDTWVEALEARGVRSREPWMRTVLRRVAGRRREENARRRMQVLERENDLPDGDDLPPQSDALDRLHDLLNRMQGRSGEVLRLRYVEGLQLREISKRLDVPLGTIKYEHAQALRAVRASLDVGDDEQRRRTMAALLAVPLPSTLERPTREGARLSWLGWSLAAGSAAVLSAALLQSFVGSSHDDRPSTEGPATEKVVLAQKESAAPERAVAAPEIELPADEPGQGRTPVEPESGEVAPPPPARLVRVRVTDGSAPIERGRVILHGESFAVLGQAALGADGDVSLALKDLVGLRAPMRAGGNPVVGVAVRDANRAVPHIYFVEIGDDDPARFEIALEQPELVLRGSVTDEQGVPIAGARVLVGASSDSPEPLEPGLVRIERTAGTRTDSAGRFSLDRLAPGAQGIQVTAPGFERLRLERTVDAHGVFELPEALVLERAAQITGTVRKADGSPAAGAMVWLEAFDSRPELSPTLSDEHGRYTIDTVPSGEHIVWALLTVDDRRLTGRGSANTAASTADELDLVVEDRYLGVLRLADEEGEPLVGWRVYAVTMDPKRSFRENLVTDERGEVVLARDPQTPVHLLFLDVGPGSFSGQMPRGVQRVEEPIEGVLEIRLAPPLGASIEGRVRNDDGGPIALTEFVLFAPEIRYGMHVPLGEDGSFRCAGLLPGRYLGLARVAHQDGLRGVFEVEVDEEAATSGETRDLGELRLRAAD